MKPFTHILSFDPTIDMEKSNLAEYIVNGCNPEVLGFLDGKKPMLFHCKRLTRDEIKSVRNAGSPQDSNEAAFKRGLIKVDGLVKPDGNRYDWFKQENVALITDKILEAYFSESMIQEVGAIIWQNSVLMVGSTVPYVLPPTSGLEVKGLLRLNAERLRISLNLEEDKTKLKETPQDQPLNDGDAPMDVPVPESQEPQKA